MWLARDNDNDLFLFIRKKHYKTRGMWNNPNVRCIMIQAKYPNVKWHNEEQTDVEIIIKK